jgi:hypothetical protein
VRRFNEYPGRDLNPQAGSPAGDFESNPRVNSDNDLGARHSGAQSTVVYGSPSVCLPASTSGATYNGRPLPLRLGGGNCR